MKLMNVSRKQWTKKDRHEKTRGKRTRRNLKRIRRRCGRRGKKLIKRKISSANF